MNALEPNPLTPQPPEAAACLGLYEQMVLIRQFELAAQKNYRAGRMPGFIHLYVGEEAVAVGVCAHLQTEDWITSTHRGHGHAIAKGVPPKTVLAELYGRATGCNGGRGGSMHLFSPGVGLLGTNGIVAGGIPAAVGAGLSAKVRGSGHVVVAFFGDGAVNHGSFHESLNLAGAQNAPVIFVCENNLYATATPFETVTRNTEVASRGAACGVPGVSVDGNDVLAVFRVVGEAVARARGGGGPTLIEARTYRTVGHHEGDVLVGTYRTQEELDRWKTRCPIQRFRRWLLAEGLASEKELAERDARAQREIDEAVAFAESSPLPDPATANDHVLADPINPPIAHTTPVAPETSTTELNWLAAVRDGVAEEMRRDPHLIYLGEGIGERGGSFGHTKGLWREFGRERVIDTPICELGFTGAAAGASATGCRAVADLMFIDFLFDAASQVILQMAKLRYMSGGRVHAPVVIRASIGAIKNAGPHHSGCYYPVYAHCPGLIVCVPSNPADAKGLMKTALNAGDPVIFLEHKVLFSVKGQVPVGDHYVPFGKANVVREGKDLTIVSCGAYLHRCLEAAPELARGGIQCDIIDLRTIVPLDVETIVASVAKTGRLLVVDEAHPMCGVGAEIAARVMEHAFDELDAPVGRLHPDPVTEPFSPALENEIVVTVAKVVAAAKAVVAGRPIPPRRPKADAPAPVPEVACTPVPAIAPGPVGTAPGPAAASPPPKAAETASPTGPRVPVILPNADLTVTEATVVRWLKQVGDVVLAGEPLLEVETVKAVSPIESPATGTLVEILVTEGTTVGMTDQLGTIQPG